MKKDKKQLHWVYNSLDKYYKTLPLFSISNFLMIPCLKVGLDGPFCGRGPISK